MRLIIILILVAFSFDSFSQHTMVNNMTEEELELARFRKELKIKTYKMISKDSSYYYSEEYNEDGNIISHRDIDFDKTVYEYNNKGKRVCSYEVIGNEVDTNWNAYYECDTLLFKVIRYNNAQYTEEINYDPLEREISRYKYFKKDNRVDSTITEYDGLIEKEIRFEKGEKVLFTSTLKTREREVSKSYHFENNDTIHYLTWTDIYDSKGRKTKRVQKFFDRNLETVYDNEYRDDGKVEISIVSTNGKMKFKIIKLIDVNGNIMKSTHIEEGYKSISEYTYTENGLESKSIHKVYKEGELPEIEEYIYEYTYFE